MAIQSHIGMGHLGTITIEDILVFMTLMVLLEMTFGSVVAVAISTTGMGPT